MTDSLMDRARALGLHGLVAHWDEVAECDWLSTLIAWEEEEKRARSLKRRLADARLGEFKPLADFNWDWPRRCDRMAIEDLMGLEFLKEHANVVLVGPNGVGKSTIAANIAHRAVLEGHTVRFATAASMLGELAAIDSDTMLQRKLRLYARQHLLVIDEVGYLSYSNRHADLLFNIVSSRSQQRSTIVTTNRPFAEWGEAFPNAACLVALVDRLVHNAEIIAIDGDSYRRKEAAERQKQRSAERRRRREAKQRRRSGKGGPRGHRGRLRRTSPCSISTHGIAACRRRGCEATPSKTSSAPSATAATPKTTHAGGASNRSSASTASCSTTICAGSGAPEPSTWWSMCTDVPCPTPWPSSRSCGATPGAWPTVSALGCRTRPSRRGRSASGAQWNATSSTSAASRPCSSPWCRDLGLLYADRHANAVFLCRNAAGEETGTEIVPIGGQSSEAGTAAEAPPSPLTPGSFWMSWGAGWPPSVLVAKSAIDALSALSLQLVPVKREGCAAISAGAVAATIPSWIEAWNPRRIFCAYDATPDGDDAAQRLLRKDNRVVPRPPRPRRRRLERHAHARTLRRTAGDRRSAHKLIRRRPIAAETSYRIMPRHRTNGGDEQPSADNNPPRRKTAE